MTSTCRLAALLLADYQLPAGVAARLHSPALLVFGAKVQTNIEQMLSCMGGDSDRWRPHLKTTKTPEVWARLLGAGVRHFKCATVREARVFAELVADMGADDVDLLVAYPLVATNLDAVAQLGRLHPRLRLAVLSEEPGHAAAVPPQLGVFVDINPQMNRSGVPMAETAAIAAVARAAGARFAGLHFYEGQVRDAEPALRQERSWRLYARLLLIATELEAAGMPVGELVTSGTPSFPAALKFTGFAGPGSWRHRVSPGTVVFHDTCSDELLGELGLLPAAVLFTRVVSHPAPGIVTCDAGSKSLAAEAGDPAAFVIGYPGLLALTGSEEHLPLQVLHGPVPARGQELLLVPRHVCPTVNLAEELLWIEPGQAPRAVAVRARGHDLLADRGSECSAEPGIHK